MPNSFSSVIFSKRPILPTTPTVTPSELPWCWWWVLHRKAAVQGKQTRCFWNTNPWKVHPQWTVRSWTWSLQSGHSIWTSSCCKDVYAPILNVEGCSMGTFIFQQQFGVRKNVVRICPIRNSAQQNLFLDIFGSLTTESSVFFTQKVSFKSTSSVDILNPANNAALTDISQRNNSSPFNVSSYSQHWCRFFCPKTQLQ